MGWSQLGGQSILLGQVKNVPVSSTSFVIALGSIARANINQGETTPTPAKTDRSVELSQSGFNDQCLFMNGNFIDELPFGLEQIAAFICTSTDQFGLMVMRRRTQVNHSQPWPSAPNDVPTRRHVLLWVLLVMIC